MKVFFFYAIFFFVLYSLFPRIGLSNYVDKSKGLDPKDGIDKHYRYDPRLCKFHWGLIAVAYTLCTLCPVIDYLLGISIPDDKIIFLVSGLTILISLSCVPYIMILLSLKYNPKGGVYIYEQKIECIGKFYGQTIYKSDIENIEFRGILWGFVIKKKNTNKNAYIMCMTDNLPQQIATLTNYVKL